MPALTSFALAAIGAGTTISAVTGFAQAGFQSSMQKYNARLAERDAEQQVLNANAARKEAGIASMQQRKSNARVLGSLRARAGANGFADAGSPLESIADAATQLELQALSIDREGELRARGYENASFDSRVSGAQSRANARFTQAAAPLQAAGTVLGGASLALQIQGL